jgi:hypothetical protein
LAVFIDFILIVYENFLFPVETQCIASLRSPLGVAFRYVELTAKLQPCKNQVQRNAFDSCKAGALLLARNSGTLRRAEDVPFRAPYTLYRALFFPVFLTGKDLLIWKD